MEGGCPADPPDNDAKHNCALKRKLCETCHDPAGPGLAPLGGGGRNVPGKSPENLLFRGSPEESQMQHSHPVASAGAGGVPAAEAFETRLRRGENVRASLEVDLDGRLRFSAGGLRLTDQRLLSLEASEDDPGAPVLREWPLTPDLRLVLSGPRRAGHAGAGRHRRPAGAVALHDEGQPAGPALPGRLQPPRRGRGPPGRGARLPPEPARPSCRRTARRAPPAPASCTRRRRPGCCCGCGASSRSLPGSAVAGLPADAGRDRGDAGGALPGACR